MLIWIIVFISWVVSTWCLYTMWSGRAKVARKLIWTLILIVPLFGPLAYGALFVPPSELPADLRAPEYDQTRHGLGDNIDYYPPEHHHGHD